MGVQRFVIGNFRDTEQAFRGGGSAIVNRPLLGTVDGSNATFVLEGRPRAGSLAVYKNGIRQRETVDFDVTYAATTAGIEFATPPAVGAWLIADFYE